MPEELLDSGSEFDFGKARLGQWLRDASVRPRALSRVELGIYSKHAFKAGWAIVIEHGGEVHAFDVLVDGEFPYSGIRIALTSKNMFLEWPHVEHGGLLCLPQASSPMLGVPEAADVALASSLHLIEQCQNQDFVDSEFRREFLSYWSNSAHNDERATYSLLDISDRSTRSIAVWFGKSFLLVAENADEVRKWLSNSGRTEPFSIVEGVFGHLDEGPVPPFPNCPRELFEFLARRSLDTLRAIERCSCARDLIVVLGATAPTGEGLVSVRITAPPTNGFRKSQADRHSSKMMLWRTRSILRRTEVSRVDASWVHGRGLNLALPGLQTAKVLFLGCGSLGSQVAVRLAQSGVGHLTLVDPDSLAPANAGRHALGLGAVGSKKAVALATELRRRFPHIRNVQAHASSWQRFYSEHSDEFETFDLIVACIGEWSADGQLAELQGRENGVVPVVYGWLDEYGTAAHAIVLSENVPSLTCILGPDGNLRIPETIWENNGRVQSEPACGTLFQPYGAIDVALAEALVSKLCVDVLSGAVHAPKHRVYAGPTEQLTVAGGTWSEEHLRHRPAGYQGAFEYERPIEACNQCPSCRRAV